MKKRDQRRLSLCTCRARPPPVIIRFGGQHQGMLRFIIVACIDGHAALTLWLIKLAIDNPAIADWARRHPRRQRHGMGTGVRSS
jgi:hypothetical protein